MTNDFLSNILLVFFIGAVIFLLSIIPYAVGQRWGYRDGQIDALNGKIYYRLEKQDNSEFQWVECPATCNYDKASEQ